MFKLALIQMAVEGGNKKRNLCHAKEMINQAASESADLVLLPEAMDIGWTYPATKTIASAIPNGDTCRLLREAAKKNKVYVCSGLIEKEGKQIFNSAVLINPQGEVLIRHRKLNELEIGHPYYAQGDRLNVCHTPLGTLGLMICADAGAKDCVLTQSLCYMGADIILSPSSWAVPSHYNHQKTPYGKTWTKVYIPVAKKYAVWIAGVSNVGHVQMGPWKGWKCIGCSMIVDPKGKVVLKGPYGVDAEEILYINIEPLKRPARGCAWKTYWGEKN